MSVAQRLGAREIQSVIATFRDLLLGHKEMINALNVYPVPDGDTGTNMSLTLESVCAELEGAEDLDEVCKAISHGSLMGARGNSGVIMSQILRGLADTVRVESAAGGEDAQIWAKAFAVAATAAYGAVQRPVEGTILTVVREVAEGATAAAETGADLVATLEAGQAQGHDALARTPDMLPVLKDAGVVDAGGQGLLLLLDALLHTIDGRELPIAPTDFVRVSQAPAPAPAANNGEKSIADLRYEVMFFLDANDDRIDEFRSAWAEIGDSIVVVGGDGIWNCHIHSDDIGGCIEAGIAVGRPHKIRVTDLLEELEHMESLVDPNAPAQPDGTEASIIVNATEQSRCGVITVGVGEGIRAIFESLGATAMVLGGQTMNPPTELLLHAVNQVPADEVLLLPNNKNIIPVANQVNDLTDKIVRVIPTRSITEGFAALLEFDPEAAADDNAVSMTEAASSIVAGEVTQAVRDANSDAGPVSAGDYIGIGPVGITAVASDVVTATTSLIESLLAEDHELLTLIAGDDATEAGTSLIEAWLEDHHPDIDIEVHQGEQPLYHYYLGIE
ncbi:DAK2 domain-containing protein [bacterium]|nr:DAK2 domain-containing protein [bacterium]